LRQIRVIAGEQVSLREDGQTDKNLDLIGQTHQKSLGSMAFHCICCGFCCAPAVCRCAC